MVIVKKRTKLWAIILCIMLFIQGLSFNTLSVQADNQEQTTKRLNIDTTTKGNWSGKYGTDTAILFGYKFSFEDAAALKTAAVGDIDGLATAYNSSTGRFFVKAREKDLIVNNANANYLNSYRYDTAGNLSGFLAEEGDTSLLVMPSVEGAGKNAYHARVVGGTPQRQVNYEAAKSNVPTDGKLQGENFNSNYRCSIYTVNITDTASHVLSLYSSIKNDADVYINITDLNGTLLLSDKLETGKFLDQGTYVSYQICGSVKIYVWQDATKEQDKGNWFGISAMFLDAELNVEQTQEPDLVNNAFRVGIDTATQGNWSGKYGTDTAILFGYSFSFEDAAALKTAAVGDIDGLAIAYNSSTGRFYVKANKKDLIVNNVNESYLGSYKYDSSGELFGYLAKEGDTSLLVMPNVEGAGKNAYHARVVGGKPQRLVDSESAKLNVPTEGSQSGEVFNSNYRCSIYTVNITDTASHVLSLYSSIKNNADVYINITDLNDNLLFSDKLEAGTFSDDGTYVSYLISGSVKIYAWQDSMAEQYADQANWFGMSAIFLDAVGDNKTFDLTVSEGDASRSTKLTWSEKDDIAADTDIIIERKLTEENIWREIAVVDSGVKEYQDENLVVEKEYIYRLRTKQGNTYSNITNEEVAYKITGYTQTVLSIEKQQYTVSNCSEQVDVSVSLKDASGNACSNQEISLTVDWGHSVQTIGIETTDSEGVVNFKFNPNFLGSATVKASFGANDTDMLMNSSAESNLFVGETTWNVAPVLYKISDAVLPDDLININGYGLKADDMSQVVIKYAPHTSDNISAEPPESAGVLENVQTDARDGYYIVTKLPASAEAGIYDIWVNNGNGWSEPITMNESRPLFINEYEVWEGQNIEISGRNLDAKQFGLNKNTKVRLNNGNNTYEQDLAKLSPYSITFTIKDTPIGSYSVEVSNDNGANWRSLSSGQTLNVVEKGQDPLGLGYAWMDHFAWENRFDVTAYGATGNDTTDDTDAIHAAIKAAKESGQDGGIVYFPNGNYYISKLNLPGNIVLLGEDMDNTFLYFNGIDGDLMFESTEDGRTEGHNGFAEFSLRLSNNNIVPKQFFWLGRTWEDRFSRTASEFFLYHIDITYPLKMDNITNGEVLVVIGDERLLIKDCHFSGNRTCINSVNLNRYSGYYGVDISYNLGYFQSAAKYHFVEDCKLTGGLVNGEGLYQNHGIFGKDSCHIENNLVKDIGSYGTNDGESICVEHAGGFYEYGEVINASNESVLITTHAGSSADDWHSYGRLAVRITTGKGMGQLRDVKSLDYEEGVVNIELAEAWDVIPDSTSKIWLHTPLDNVTVYNNEIQNSVFGVSLYGNIYDAVVANNIFTDNDGIYLHSAAVTGRSDIQSGYVSIRENVLSGLSPKTNDVKISMRSNRQINNGNYYSTGIYSVEIRDNQLTAVRGEESNPTHNPVRHSGLVSYSCMTSSFANADGYCGDNTNIIMENNYLKDLDVAITTTLGDYGFVLKGNQFENVGTRINNTNENGTGNLLEISNEGNIYLADILSNFVDVWEGVKGDCYTEESYSALQTAIAEAKGILETDGAEPDTVAKALQDVRISAGSLKSVVNSASEDGSGNIEDDGFTITAPTGVTITAPTGGWVEGTNTFTVSNDNACVVAVKNADGTYSRVTAVATETNGVYSYTVENMTAETEIIVALSGDANGDGKVSNADITKLRAACAGKATLDGMQTLLGDVNGNGKVTNADVTRLRAACASKKALNW